jgi:hypothetical protein
MRGNHANVFGVRTLTDAESLHEAEAKLDQGSNRQLFGAMCSEVTATEDQAWITMLRAPHNISYHGLQRLLDDLGSSTLWERRHVVRPVGAAPGFLTALSRLMSTSVEDVRHGRNSNKVLGSLPYVYKGSVYEMTLFRAAPVVQMRIGQSAFHDLIRGMFTIRNAATGDKTRFAITYGTQGALAGVPLEAVYQPHWWLKVKLALDESVNVPTGPARDKRMLEQIDHVCEAAQQRSR